MTNVHKFDTIIARVEICQDVRKGVFFVARNMSREFAGNFYKTAAWIRCRQQYIRKTGGLCEQCEKKGLIRHGTIVHHKIALTPENIKDPAVTLNDDNLELLCRDCHAEAHKRRERRYTVGDRGEITARED